MNIKSRLLQQTLGNKIQFETSGRLLLGGEKFYEIKKILIRNFNRLYNNIWTVACVILMHIDAVQQFRQIQTPEDSHVGRKHVV
jgi:hypothetical protein